MACVMRGLGIGFSLRVSSRGVKSLDLRKRVRNTGMEAAMMVMAPSAPPQMVTATVSAVGCGLVYPVSTEVMRAGERLIRTGITRQLRKHEHLDEGGHSGPVSRLASVLANPKTSGNDLHNPHAHRNGHTKLLPRGHGHLPQHDPRAQRENNIHNPRVSRRPLKQGDDRRRRNALPLNSAVPDLGNRPALDPHEQHGRPQYGIDGDEDKPDQDTHPSLR